MLTARVLARFALVPVVLFPFAALAQSGPRVTHNAAKVHTAPRPHRNATQITPYTTIYFEVTVPTTNPAEHLVDPNSVTATITRTGGSAVTMISGNQTWAPGYSGQVVPSFTDGTRTGYGFYTVPATPLLPSSTYTIRVQAATLGGLPIDGTTSNWPFTTRRSLGGSTLALDVDASGLTLEWEGRFYSGMLKPNFDTSRTFDQEPVYRMIDEARADAPDFFEHQRDWPLFSDYWSGGGYFDGNPNLVRERESRRIVGIVDETTQTELTLADLVEGTLYGIAPGRRLSEDYAEGDQVLVCDREKSEVATVLTVRSGQNKLIVSKLQTPAASWILDYQGSRPGDNPDTPGNFPYPLGTLRKLSPPGTPVYYWARLDDEWDQHVAHGRKPHVNFESTSVELCRSGLLNGTHGGDCADLPKDWIQWHGVVRAVVDHVVDRYGPNVADWYWVIGNEPNHNQFWRGTDDEFLAYYDHTANAILHALESRGIDMGRVRLGGPEAGGSADPVGYVSHLLYHGSPTVVDPSPGFEERNWACLEPRLDGLRSTRVQAICDAGGHGTPIDFLTIHCYKRAADSADSLIQLRRRSLEIDAATYHHLPMNSHETTPDWVTSRDPGGREMYRWGGYFSSWGGDFFRRMLDEGMTDPRKRAGETTLTTWPYHYNMYGTPSVAGQLRIDEDGDGDEDRVDAVPVPFFHFAHLAATMSHTLAPLPTTVDAGVTISGWRSVETHGEKLLLYAHDVFDAESREPGGWDVTLRLRNLRFPMVEVTEYRLDNDHPARAALAAMPVRTGQQTYRPDEVAAFVDAARLRPIGPPVRHTVVSGALDLPTRVLAGAVVFLDLKAFDPDGDGVYEPEDCAPDDPLTYRLPGEVPGLVWTDATTLAWTSVVPEGGPSTVHDVARSEVCLASGLGGSSLADPAVPPVGIPFQYLVRGRNPCGAGSWGRASDGTERTAACP